MERRKLIKQGKGGYTIYLPKKWIDRKGLKEGDEIKITETNTSLVIDVDVKTKKEIEIRIDDINKNDIKNLLTHSYRNGYDKIILNYTSFDINKQVNNTLQLLMGFEIIHKDNQKIILENISEPAEQKYDVLLRRVFIIIKESISLYVNDYDKGVFSNFEDITEFRKSLDRYILFLRRILNKEIEKKNLVMQWELLTFLMHINHSVYYLYKALTNKKLIENKIITELNKELNKYYGLYYDAFFKKDLNCIHTINTSKNKLIFGKCMDELEKSSGIDSIILSSIKEILRLIQIGSSPIFVLSFDDKFEV